MKTAIKASLLAQLSKQLVPPWNFDEIPQFPFPQLWDECEVITLPTGPVTGFYQPALPGCYCMFISNPGFTSICVNQGLAVNPLWGVGSNDVVDDLCITEEQAAELYAYENTEFGPTCWPE